MRSANSAARKYHSNKLGLLNNLIHMTTLTLNGSDYYKVNSRNNANIISVLEYPNTLFHIYLSSFLVDNSVINARRNPSDAEVFFVQFTTVQIIMKIILTKSCGYSDESSCWVPFIWVPICKGFSHFFLQHFVSAKLLTSSIRVNWVDPARGTLACSMVCNRSWHLKWNPKLVRHPARGDVWICLWISRISKNHRPSLDLRNWNYFDKNAHCFCSV